MLALHSRSRQVVVTDEEFDSTDMMGKLLGLPGATSGKFTVRDLATIITLWP